MEAVDLAPTLCRIAGIGDIETFDGKDLGRLLAGEDEEIHKIGVTEFAWSKSIRKGKYRYVYYPVEMFRDEYPDGFGELYDLEQDPWEMKNLYFDCRYEAVIREMKDDMIDWLITTTRPKTILPMIRETNRQRVMRYMNAVNHDGKISTEEIRKFLKKRDENYTYDNYI